MHRLGNGDDSAPQMPSQHDLRRRPVRIYRPIPVNVSSANNPFLGQRSLRLHLYRDPHRLGLPDSGMLFRTDRQSKRLFRIRRQAAEIRCRFQKVSAIHVRRFISYPLNISGKIRLSCRTVSHPDCRTDRHGWLRGQSAVPCCLRSASCTHPR